jgi:elongator complex protein 3
MMPNLFMADVASDKQDYLDLWGPDYSPDELKIYPTSVIKGTLLYKYYQEGKYRPYKTDELVDLLKYCFVNTPRYCRLSRVIRDIPSTEISAGNKTTNLRQIVELALTREGKACQCIRCREVKAKAVQWDDLELESIDYKTSIGLESFISYRTKVNDKIAGFLRLSLYDKLLIQNSFMPEINDCAMIREVHVYGKVTELGTSDKGHTQHLGIGKKLISLAEAQAKKMGYKKIAVISAIGTREYYRKFGYQINGLYQVKDL